MSTPIPLHPVDPAVVDITKAMGTAIGPVFLISGAGTLLAAMAVRYGRAIDRARFVLAEHSKGGHRSNPHIEREVRGLYRRARLLRTTIIFNVISLLLLLCSLALFIEDFAISLGGLKLEISSTFGRDIFKGHQHEPLNPAGDLKPPA